METEFVVARLLHIVFGGFWAGSAMFMAVILEPRLRALGPAIQGPVMAALTPVLIPVMLISATITIVSGGYLTEKLWVDVDFFFDSGWGRAIFIGLIATAVAYASGVTTSFQGKKMIRMGAAIQGRPPTPEELGSLTKQGALLRLLGRITAVFTLIAVGTMASARFLV
jgi:hypothetical protein